MSDQFFLTLPSNTQRSDVQNTTSEFSVRLPYKLVLHGDWECALCEFIYPNTWYNVSEEENHIIFYDIAEKTRHILKIPATRYESAADLVDTINASIKMLSKQEKVSYTEYINFNFVRMTHAVILRVNLSKIKSFELSNHLRFMLGFEKTQLKLFPDGQKVKTVASHPPDMRAGFESMYIYCNIIEQQISGDILAPLLTVVNTEGKFGDVINKIYDAPHYLPVLLKDINTIEISIRTDANKPVKFMSGKTIIKLHFRKKRIL